MALDLAQFHDAFFDESFEALDTMEAALLKLNVGAPEPEIDQHDLPRRALDQGRQRHLRFRRGRVVHAHVRDAARRAARQSHAGDARHHRPAAQVGGHHARDAARRAAQVADRCAARGRPAVRSRAGDRAEESQPAAVAAAAAGAAAGCAGARSGRRIAGASSSVRIRSCSRTATIRCACCASSRISAI